MDPEIYASENPFILFKKRFFVNAQISLLSPLEDSLLSLQYLGDVSAGRVPLTEADIVRILALKAILEFGSNADPLVLDQA